MKYFAFIPLLLFISLSSAAQDKTVFSSQNYAGILMGKTITSYQVQTINGVRYKTWFGGIGAGFDGYYDNSIPLFASVSKWLFKKRSGFYLSGDAGINFGCPASNQRRFEGSDFEPGLYLAGGLGYKIGMGKKKGLLIYAGY